MTTDPFTEAARAEAEALVNDIIHWDDTTATDGPCDGTWDSLAAHLIGRGWARTRLAERHREEIAKAHQERNMALDRARRADELLRNVGDHLAEQEPTDAETPDPSVDYHAMWWKAEREREKAERERDEARDGARVAFARYREVEKFRQEVVDELYTLRAAEPHPLTPETIEAPTITLYRAPDPNHVRVKVEHPAFGVFGEAVHLPNTPATVADDLWVSFSSEEVLIEHPLIGRHARRLGIPVTDEMVDRAFRATIPHPAACVSEAVIREMLTAALTEPPARPKWVGKAGQ